MAATEGPRIAGIASLDVVEAVVRRERDAQLRRFDALDAQAGEMSRLRLLDTRIALAAELGSVLRRGAPPGRGRAPGSVLIRAPGDRPGGLGAERGTLRIGCACGIGRAPPEEVAQVVEGLDEIIGD
ncbi:MAG TPA: hypothetical protein VNO79_14920 [Actinomycetota bacterium]|nr:hypothetical protein [Actinomycetota bacterium]